MADVERIRAFLAQPLLEFTPAPCPAQVGCYRVLRLLGEGGSAVVLLGEGPEGEVAIKLAHHPGAALPEATVLPRLLHDRIPGFVASGQLPDGRAYLVRRYVSGCSLREASFGDLASYSRCLEELLDILTYAHQQNVLHRDLKPENVLVSPDGRPWLIDFGAAGEALRAEGFTHTVNAPLTPRYASPEQLRGEPATVASDIYAYGLMLSEGLKRFPASAWRNRLGQVADCCLAHDPRQRYPNAKATKEAIAAASPRRVARQRSAMALAGLLFAALLLSGWRWAGQKQFERQRDELQSVVAGQWQAVENSTDVATSIAALQSAEHLLADLERQRPNDASVLHMRTQSLLRMAQLQGHPAFLNAGNQMAARRLYAEALKVGRRYARLAPDACAAQGMVVEIALSLSSMRIDAGDIGRAGSAMAAAGRAFAAMRQMGGCGDFGERLEAYWLAQSSRFSFARKDWEECLRLRHIVLARREHFFQGQTGVLGFQLKTDLMEAHTSLGYALAAAGNPLAASEHYRVALMGLEALREQYPAAVLLANRLARSHRQMAAIQRQLRHEPAAIEHEARALVIEKMLVMPWQAPVR